jgi:fluoroquinolone transport system permease protein
MMGANKTDFSMIATLSKFDILFQVKQGFYLVYAVVTLVYLLILFSIPATARTEVTAYLILSDTSIIGVTFMGALVLLEKQQNTLQSLFITPVKLSSYLWAKVLSLTLIAIVTSAIIGFVPGGLVHNWPATLLSVGLTSLFFSFFGLGLAASSETLNDYLANIMLGGLIMCLPIALYFFLPGWSLLFPINASIDLLLVSPEAQGVKGIIGNTAVLVCWNLLAYLYAHQQFSKHIIHK